MNLASALTVYRVKELANYAVVCCGSVCTITFAAANVLQLVCLTSFCANAQTVFLVEVLAGYAVGNRDSIYTNTVAGKVVPLLICQGASLSCTEALT